MNKKLLLIALPALMVMSSCTYMSSATNVNKGADLFVEDTLAHEEIFGGEEDTVELGLVKNNPFRATLPEANAKIGYQIQYNSTTDKISIRFIAALTDSSVNAVWHRGIAQPNGYEGVAVTRNKGETNETTLWKYKFSGEDGDPVDLTSHTKYKAVNNGGVRLVAGETAGYEDYECFVIYTLMNIPYDANMKESYLAAYVSLGSNNSQGMAVKIEANNDYTASKNRFYFDPISTGYFLEGTINDTLFDGGENGLYWNSGNTPSGKHAWYEHLSLKSGDSFGSFYYAQGSHFQFFSYSDFFGDVTSNFDPSSLSGFASPHSDLKCHLYVSSDNADEYEVSIDTFYYVTFYVDTTKLDSWTPSASGYFIHAYGDGGDYTGTWGSGTMSLVTGQSHLYSYELEMIDGKTISNVQLGFNQSGAPKKSKSISCNISTSGAYDITYNDASWTNDEMYAEISLHS